MYCIMHIIQYITYDEVHTYLCISVLYKHLYMYCTCIAHVLYMYCTCIVHKCSRTLFPRILTTYVYATPRLKENSATFHSATFQREFEFPSTMAGRYSRCACSISGMFWRRIALFWLKPKPNFWVSSGSMFWNMKSHMLLKQF